MDGKVSSKNGMGNKEKDKDKDNAKGRKEKERERTKRKEDEYNASKKTTSNGAADTSIASPSSVAEIHSAPPPEEASRRSQMIRFSPEIADRDVETTPTRNGTRKASTLRTTTDGLGGSILVSGSHDSPGSKPVPIKRQLSDPALRLIILIHFKTHC